MSPMSSMPPFIIRREGWPFIAISALATLALFGVMQGLGWIGLIVTGWCILFFRDPVRITPLGDDLVISPADGVVLPIVEAPPPPELEMDPTPLRRVSIFMNVFDVHVNRSPVEATVDRSVYRPGAFFNASFDKASDQNERRSLRLKMAQGKELAVVQIAGLVARRILCWTEESETLRAGERFGMIRFGSRVDVYLPPGTRVLVVPGQRSVGGETVIAELNADDPDRSGESH